MSGDQTSLAGGLSSGQLQVLDLYDAFAADLRAQGVGVDVDLGFMNDEVGNLDLTTAYITIEVEADLKPQPTGAA